MAEAAHKPAEREHKPAAHQPAEQATPSGAQALDDAGALVAAASDAGAVARHAAVLSDPRVQGAAQRTRLMRQLQRGYGNGYVERVLAQVQRKEDCASPEPPQAVAPEQDPKFGNVSAKLGKVASKEKQHEPAAKKAKQAQDAAAGPPNELASKAAASQVGAMGQQQPGTFDKGAFLAALHKAIDEATPQNQEQADEFKKSGKAGEIKQKVAGTVSKGKEQSEQGIKQATNATPSPAGAQPKPVTPLEPLAPGATPTAAQGGKAMPDKRPPEQLSLDHTKCATDGQMAEADVTEEQLKKGNEPQFEGALQSKQQAEAHAAAAPQQVRAEEQTTLGQAQAAAGASTAQALAAMHGNRAGALGHTAGGQSAARSADEAARARVAADLEAIYGRAKTDVNAILEGLQGKVDTAFDAGERDARAAFENYVDQKMTDYKLKRYLLTPLGPVLWLKDKLLDMPPEVNAFYQEGRKLYMARMETVLGNVADIVGAELTHAKTRIADGRNEIKKHVEGLSPALREVGQQAAQNIQGQFDQLNQNVDAKQDEVAQGLAQKYVAARAAVDDRIKQMQEENKGLVSKAKDAIGGAIQTIIELKNMLMGVLAKAAGAIDKIIKDPIGFLGNLVKAIKLGLSQFLANIGTHLKKGLMGWLFGQLAEAGIQLPASFDLKGIMGLVLQLLGLTYANIRMRAVKLVGEKTVKALEGAVEVFQILLSEGPAGLWKFIVGKLGELKDQALEAIKGFVTDKVITAGITWLVSLFNPASAFIRACKMIVDVVMFFVERGSQIMGLVNSILDGIGAIADGAIGGAANLVEQSLGKAVPVAISFLSSLLGLGGISTKVKEVIGTIQKPVNSLVDGVVKGALKMGKGLVKGIKGKLGKKESPEEKEKRLQKGMAAGVASVNKYAGKRIGAMVLKPILGAVKIRHRLSVLQVAAKGNIWEVQADINRMAKADSKANNDKSEGGEHRGRIQVQGKDLRKETSWTWANTTAPTASSALAGLESMKNNLNKSELEVRTEAFEKAKRFITNAGASDGVSAPVSVSFQNSNLPKSNKTSRVDIEVRKGKAFAKG